MGGLGLDGINYINLQNLKMCVGCVITVLNNAGVCIPLLPYRLPLTLAEGAARKSSSIKHQFCFILAKGTSTHVRG